MPLSILISMCSKRKRDGWTEGPMKQASFIKNLYIPFFLTHMIWGTLSFLIISSFPFPHLSLPLFNLPTDNWGSRVCMVCKKILSVCVCVHMCVAGNEPGLGGRGATKTVWGRAARAAYLTQYCSTRSIKTQMCIQYIIPLFSIIVELRLHSEQIFA